MPACRNFRTALLTLICVVGIFLFPAAIGSFSATHGPVTAMRAASEAQKTKRSISSSKISAVKIAHSALPSNNSDPEITPYVTQATVVTIQPVLALSASLRI